MSDRSHPIIGDHLDGIGQALQNENLDFPVNEWERPKDGDERFDDPPFAVYRVYPSTGQMMGPLSDSQADIVLRFQILGVGLTQGQAIAITDLCRNAMKKSKIVIPNRKVMDVRFMVVHAGESRDDDLPTAFHYSSDLYELWTTPE